MAAAETERALELEAHQVVTSEPDVLLRDGRAKDVLAECFTTDGVVGSGSRRGVQREAIQSGTEPFWVLDVTA